MVTLSPDTEAAIRSVKAFLSTLPPQVADIQFDEDQYEYRIDVRPKSKRHCKFWLGFSSYGTYGLCFGHGLAFEDIPLNEFPPEEVVRAILDGRVHEMVSRRFGMVVKCVGEITLYDGRILSDLAILFPFGNIRVWRRDEEYVYTSYAE
jgi:hypothetical protein